ncbi:retrovirus-related pol polyprotein from transposon TNT 1-94 [Tanacetum coccineum]
MPVLSSPLFPTPSVNFGHLIYVRLTRDNYLLWKAQFLQYLRGQRLLGYVDGTIECPPETIIDSSSNEGVINPAYQTWFQHDQMILSALLSSLTEEILGHVVFLSTSRDVWVALEKMFSSQSHARVMQVRLQLSTIQKKDLSFADYFQRVKGLADVLVSVGQPLQETKVDLPLTLQEDTMMAEGEGLTLEAEEEAVEEANHFAAFAATPTYQVDPNWYTDTGATDHITNDLDKLTLKEKYNGMEQVQVGNGAGLSISSIGHSKIPTHKSSLRLSNVLHVLQITKNLIFVSKLTKENNVFGEFHGDYFFVKDEVTKKILLEGPCKNGLYQLDKSKIVPQSKSAFLGVRFTKDQIKISLSAMLVNKQRVIVYLICHRSDVESVFLQFQNHVERLLNRKIKIVQSDWGGEYQKLNRYFTSIGIQHRVSCPHTHRQNGSAERKHRHIVEVGLDLLSQASMPMKFWDEAFQTTCYCRIDIP